MPKFRYIESGETQELDYSFSDGTVRVDDKEYPCDSKAVLMDGRRVPFWVHKTEEKTLVWLNGVVHTFEVDDPRKRSTDTAGGGAAGGTIKAQMPGKILQVAVKVGDRVEVEQNLLLMESMKMELALDAPVAGTVVTVAVEPGQMVSQGAVLVEIEEDSEV